MQIFSASKLRLNIKIHPLALEIYELAQEAFPNLLSKKHTQTEKTGEWLIAL